MGPSSLSNPILEGAYGIQIPHHTKCELILPFYIRKDMLYGDWNRLDQCVFYLHITGFPTEKDIQVQQEEDEEKTIHRCYILIIFIRMCGEK